MSNFNSFIKIYIEFCGKSPNLCGRPHSLTSTFDKPLWGRLQRTSGKWGGGGFEISDIPGRGEGVVCESSDVRKFLKKSKSKISQSSSKLKLEIIIDRDSNIIAFTYDVCSNLGVSK